jgi:hypothetical protein
LPLPLSEDDNEILQLAAYSFVAPCVLYPCRLRHAFKSYTLSVVFCCLWYVLICVALCVAFLQTVANLRSTTLDSVLSLMDRPPVRGFISVTVCHWFYFGCIVGCIGLCHYYQGIKRI